MIGREKQNKKSVVIVKTKQELDVAVKKKEPYIEVQGELVKKIKWMKILSPAKKDNLVTLLRQAGSKNPASPISAVVPKSDLGAVTGTEIALLIFASGLSISLVLSVLKGYDVTIENGDKSILLTRK